MSLSYKEVAEILKIIDASSCEEVVLEVENTRLVVRRGSASGGGEIPAPELKSNTPMAEAPISQPPGAAATDISELESDPNCTIMRSPMVGLFYCRPSPNEAPFVNLGSKIAVGDPLCLIEVMKLYTTIEATTDGVIESILVEDGKLVEFDQPIFVIRNND